MFFKSLSCKFQVQKCEKEFFEFFEISNIEVGGVREVFQVFVRVLGNLFPLSFLKVFPCIT